MVFFGGQKIRSSAIFSQFVVNIVVVAACTAGKGTLHSWVKSLVHGPARTFLRPENYLLYGSIVCPVNPSTLHVFIFGCSCKL